FPLHFHIPRKMVSEGYFHMTIHFVRKLGMKVEENGSEFFIPANQRVLSTEYVAEMDLSSAFAVAALATVGGSARLKNFPIKSTQPDLIFINILNDMGVDQEWSGRDLVVRKSAPLKGVKVNLESSPDLFPILGVLCALAKTPSEITGLGHLKYKESSRLVKTKELLEIMGAQVHASDDSVTITPVAEMPRFDQTVIFDVDQDHRMAMAATVAKWAGYPIQSNDLKVVEKSFPEFLLIAGENT
ncbi:MAG: 3-phosphoshikimate 1-carboxyvinyltransferase, partial [Bdellovibrionales bacterium]|nr:3-phosphoshikimate 1-carboxyvinyltransferase [Bdellovibrionales bacterium]